MDTDGYDRCWNEAVRTCIEYVTGEYRTWADKFVSEMKERGVNVNTEVAGRAMALSNVVAGLEAAKRERRHCQACRGEYAHCMGKCCGCGYEEPP